MGDLGQFHHALVDALAFELGDTVFGDDEVDVATRGGNAGAFAQVRNDT